MDPEALKLSEGKLGFDEAKFNLYVTKTSSFPTNFPALKTTWKGKEDDITKAKVDYLGDPYFTSLCAAYVLFHKSGICTEHFRIQDEVHPVVTSIFRFYVYWHMRRFLRQPKLLNAWTPTISKWSRVTFLPKRCGPKRRPTVTKRPCLFSTLKREKEKK